MQLISNYEFVFAALDHAKETDRANEIFCQVLTDYMKIMNAQRRAGITIGDRKTEDFRYDEQSRKHIVIDFDSPHGASQPSENAYLSELDNLFRNVIVPFAKELPPSSPWRDLVRLITAALQKKTPVLTFEDAVPMLTTNTSLVTPLRCLEAIKQVNALQEADTLREDDFGQEKKTMLVDADNPITASWDLIEAASDPKYANRLCVIRISDPHPHAFLLNYKFSDFSGLLREVDTPNAHVVREMCKMILANLESDGQKIAVDVGQQLLNDLILLFLDRRLLNDHNWQRLRVNLDTLRSLVEPEKQSVLNTVV